MSDHDHGAYTPPSDRLSFDPREPVRSGGPAPVTLIISGIVLLAIVGGVFMLYRGGVRHKSEAPAVVGAPLAQIKTSAPPDSTNDTAPGLTISKLDATNTAAASTVFAPPPEEPLPRPLPVQAPSAIEPPPTPKPAKPVTIASLTDDALAPKRAVKPAAKPPLAAADIPAPEASASGAAAPGAGWVQIGAFSSTALADKGWSDVATLAPAAMAGKGRKVEALSKDGKTLYRAYVTGFASRDTAQAFCDRLKAAGKACFVK
jgi:cell division protein FtsN